MKKIFLSIIALALACNIFADDLPEPTQKFVNDFAGILTSSQVDNLEKRLQEFCDESSNQICAVTISDLGDYSAADYAQRLGQKWGIGSKHNNGIVILVKPRSILHGDGEVFIATGYGAEGGLPDAICKQIIDEDMIPHLKNKDYYAAIDAAVDNIMPKMLEEYKEGNYKPEASSSESDSSDGDMIIFLVIAIILTCGLAYLLYKLYKLFRRIFCKKAIMLENIVKAKNKTEYEKALAIAKAANIEEEKINVATAKFEEKILKMKLQNITKANNKAEYDKALAIAKAANIEEEKIHAATEKLKERFLNKLENAETINKFESLAANALALGISDTEISEIKDQIKEESLDDIEIADSKSELERKKKRALEFGNTKEDIDSVAKIALASIAAAAATAAIASAASALSRKNNDDFDNPGEQPSNQKFGGGEFGGGGAGGKF